jgi:predicted RNA-binding Zn ribbon-like protein
MSSSRTGEVGTRRHPWFHLIGGHTALDFANTVGWHAGDEPFEWLTDYPVLVAWSRQAGLVGEGDAHHLLAAAARRPAAAAAALERARTVRETIYRLFAALAGGRPVEASDLTALNDALAQAFDRLRLGARDGVVSWQWGVGREDLDRMLWPVVRAAADLLAGEERGLVRQCAGDPCGWLFLDTSRKRNRRWCSMADCGNRAKARRHRARRRTAP